MNIMKLKPLLELFEPKVSHHRSKSAPDKAMKAVSNDGYEPKNKLVKVLGNGMYAAAIEHENHPGEVTKVSSQIDDLNRDGYFRYVSNIVKNDRIQSNPYFPKIYKIKIYKTEPTNTANSAYFYTMQMEKLYSVKELSEDEVEMLMDKMFHITHSYKTGQENDHTPNVRDMIATIDYAISSGFKKVKSVNHSTNLKDPHLKQAILIIKKLVRNSGLTNDIHGGNLMFRRTSVGVQLVITDPLS